MKLIYRFQHLVATPHIVITNTAPQSLMVTWDQVDRPGIYLADSDPTRLLEIAAFARTSPPIDWRLTGVESAPPRHAQFLVELATYIAPGTLFVHASWARATMPKLEAQLLRTGVRVCVRYPDESGSRSAA